MMEEGAPKPEYLEKIQKEIETFFAEEKKKIDEFNANMQKSREEHMARLVQEMLKIFPSKS